MEFRYCEETTLNNSITLLHNNALVNINDIISRESKDCVNCDDIHFENQNNVIDFDLVEKQDAIIHNRLRNESVDMVFGVTNKSNKEMVLVELKLNMLKSPNNLDKKSIDGKVLGTLDVLKNTIAIHEKIFFIFKESFVPEAERRLQRMIPAANPNYNAISLKDLKKHLF